MGIFNIKRNSSGNKKIYDSTPQTKNYLESSYTDQQFLGELQRIKPGFKLCQISKKFLLDQSDFSLFQENMPSSIIRLFGRNEILDINAQFANWWAPDCVIVGSNNDFSTIWCIGPNGIGVVWKKITQPNGNYTYDCKGSTRTIWDLCK